MKPCFQISNLIRFQIFSYIEEQAENDTHAARSKTILFDLESKCLFYKREKHKGDNRLVRILCEYTFKKISTRCEEKSDLELLKLATGDLQVDF